MFWCDERVYHLLNTKEVFNSLNIDNKVLSFSISNNEFTKKIGYLDYSPFININRNVTYPTWIISDLVGCTKTSLLKSIDSKFWEIKRFDIFLLSLGKHYHNQGIFSYSEPKLLERNDLKLKGSELTVFEIVVFIKEHYKRFWLYLFVLNFLFFERRLILFSFIRSFFIKKVNYSKKIKMFYAFFPYTLNPKFICTIFLFFSSVYGFPHFSFHCFVIYLHLIVKIV